MSIPEPVDPGRWLDLASESPASSEPTPRGRPFVGIHFTCCDVYTRVYLDSRRDAHIARCPHCLRALFLRTGPNGWRERFFEAG